MWNNTTEEGCVRNFEKLLLILNVSLLWQDIFLEKVFWCYLKDWRQYLNQGLVLAVLLTDLSKALGCFSYQFVALKFNIYRLEIVAATSFSTSLSMKSMNQYFRCVTIESLRNRYLKIDVSISIAHVIEHANFQLCRTFYSEKSTNDIKYINKWGTPYLSVFSPNAGKCGLE